VAKVKLFLGALGGELAAELPFILMHPKPVPNKLIRGDSQAGVETFRQDTVDYDGLNYKPTEDTTLEN
jgi:arrestin-1